MAASTTYQNAGVDVDQEEEALKPLIQHIKGTWPKGGGIGSVKLDIGFFANVIDLGGMGLALTTDSVGSKVLIAQMADKYDTVGIDCVAMNVNDLLCVGARPISLIDYIAIQTAKPDLMDEISKGLCEGANMANVSVSGGETAQLDDVIKGYKEGYGFDLVGMAVGTVPLDNIIVGENIQEDDIVIGIESNGIHSNGLTLARRIFFEKNDYAIDSTFPELDHTLGEELLRPTHIYVREVLDILDQEISVKALIHNTSDGFLNLNRVVSEVGYVIEELPPIPPIFSLIKNLGGIVDKEMFKVYNMGIGFCIVVSPHETERVISIIESHGKNAYKIGRAVADKERRVTIEPYKLEGKGKEFYENK